MSAELSLSSSADSSSEFVVEPPYMRKKMAFPLQVLWGPMFSRKSTEMHIRVKRLRAVGERIKVFNYKKDKRYTQEAMSASHDGGFMEATPISSLDDIDEQDLLENYDGVAIDEAHFMGPLAPKCKKWANAGLTVIVAGLDQDYNCEAWENMAILAAVADLADKYAAICIACKGPDGTCTKRKYNMGKVREVVGGSDIYAPTCRACHMNWDILVGILPAPPGFTRRPESPASQLEQDMALLLG